MNLSKKYKNTNRHKEQTWLSRERSLRICKCKLLWMNNGTLNKRIVKLKEKKTYNFEFTNKNKLVHLI